MGKKKRADYHTDADGTYADAGDLNADAGDFNKEVDDYNKEVDDFFLDVMGHDVNNLNQVILANLELLQESNRLEARQDTFLENAILATKDCAGTVQNVRALQAIATGAVEVCDLDLSQAIKIGIRDAPRPAGKQVVIRYWPLQGPPDKGMIVRAMPELKLAVCNLIGNAIRYSSREVCIAVAAGEAKTAVESGDSDKGGESGKGSKFGKGSKDSGSSKGGGKCLVTTITDDGPGIPDGVKEKLLSPAGQDTALLHGKGLGLYTTKALAEASGGWLEVADRVPGEYEKGTIVRMALPVAGEGT